MNNPDLIARGLVLAQFVLAAAIVLGTEWRRLPAPWVALLAVLLLLIGSGLAIWAWITMGSRNLRLMPRPHHEAKLLRRGPYTWIRHPMYAGLLLAMMGCWLWDGSFMLGVGWLGLCVVLICKTRIEEVLLAEKFADYAAYCQRTWRFLPGIW